MKRHWHVSDDGLKKHHTRKPAWDNHAMDGNGISATHCHSGDRLSMMQVHRKFHTWSIRDMDKLDKPGQIA